MDYPLLNPQQLAAHLRSLRKAKNLTQEQLGKKIGLSQVRIGKIERDPRTVSIGQLMRILAFLGARFVLQVSETKETSKPPPDQTSPW